VTRREKYTATMENLYVSCYQLFERMAFTNLYKEKKLRSALSSEEIKGISRTITGYKVYLVIVGFFCRYQLTTNTLDHKKKNEFHIVVLCKQEDKYRKKKKKQEGDRFDNSIPITIYSAS
jgi:hypothetical protein